jgi:hypothetical protein
MDRARLGNNHKTMVFWPDRIHQKGSKMIENAVPYKIEGRPSTIFRTVKSKDNPYVMTDRRPVDNPRLSFKAKGILTYLLSRPDGWEVSVTDLCNHATDGEASIRSGLKELREAGHMRYTVSREQGRITGWLIEVYEVPIEQPQPPDRDFQEVENPQVEKQDLENRTQVLSTLSSTDPNKIPDPPSKPDKPKKKKDILDGMLEAAAMPGAKRDLIKKYIKARVRERLGLNAAGQTGKDFIETAADEHQSGNTIDQFLTWWLAEFPDPQFWGFARMEQNYPRAFAKQPKPLTRPELHPVAPPPAPAARIPNPLPKPASLRGA